MKVVKKILLILVLFWASWWIGNPSAISGVSVTNDAWGSTCTSQKTACNNQAYSAYTACNGQCGGNQTCLNNCTASYNGAKQNCTTYYNACMSDRGGWCGGIGCSNVCPGSGNYTISAAYSDSGTQGICNCTCACSGSPPTYCPGGPNAAGCTGSSWVCNSPIAIDVGGEGFHLTDASSGVYFDLEATGSTQLWAWTQPQAGGGVDGWLALDRNGNRAIDDGTELFGSATPQPPPNSGEIRNGFLALAVYDDPANGGNGNGYLDSGDAVYSSLLIWQDVNHDGRSQPDELIKLSDLGIDRIDLVYQTKNFTDDAGNVFRYRSRIFDKQGNQNGRWAWDVFLMKATPNLSLLGQTRDQIHVPYGGGR